MSPTRSEDGQGPAAASHGRLRRRLASGKVGAAGLLVASLTFGVVIGLSNLPQQFLPMLGDISGRAPDRSNLMQIALLDEDL